MRVQTACPGGLVIVANGLRTKFVGRVPRHGAAVREFQFAKEARGNIRVRQRRVRGPGLQFVTHTTCYTHSENNFGRLWNEFNRPVGTCNVRSQTRHFISFHAGLFSIVPPGQN